MARYRLQQKILTVILILTLIPLVILTAYSISNLNKVEKYLRENAANALDRQATDSLVLRTRDVASEVTSFLRYVESDLRTLSMLRPDKNEYISFYNAHNKELWFVKDAVEKRETSPVYKEMAFILPNGQEILRIIDGKVSGDLRNISDPKNTTYKNEDYFSKALKVQKGDIYVSKVTGFHVLKGASGFEGVIRFSVPVYYNDGRLKGVCVLSLNHAHLMEFIAHVTSTEENFVPATSYEGGNYAFMFDDEGWIIAHPKQWDIRGYDADGNLVPPYTEKSDVADVVSGRIPYNLFYAGFIHENYPVAAKAVLNKEYGVVDVTNVGGSKKIMAYAPILYDSGSYKESGVFGGVTIGAQVEQFHKPALAISDVIKNGVSGFVLRSLILLVLTFAVVIYAGYRLSRGITKPLMSLTDGIQEMSRGNFSALVDVHSEDEVGELAYSFNHMARELETRSNNLKAIIEQLNASKDEITQERNFKTVLFENIETGILTINSKNRVTSVNEPLKRILTMDVAAMGVHVMVFFEKYPEISDALKVHMDDDTKEKWSDYVQVAAGERELTLRLALLPLGEGSGEGRILTVEDLTERVNMRTQMERMRRLASLGRLSAGLAHEIRNPLTGISLMLDDLHDKNVEKPKDQATIQRALQEIERLENLINELLDFAIVKESAKQSLDVTDLISDILVFVGKQCEKSGIELVTDFKEVPQIIADGSKLKQAFINMFSNALDAMSDGGKLTVSIGSTASDLVITISDTGTGIDPGKLSLIFEPFYTNKKRGTGLGLAITHNIVSEHGGTIDVNSTPGKGTTFRISIPLA